MLLLGVGPLGLQHIARWMSNNLTEAALAGQAPMDALGQTDGQTPSPFEAQITGMGEDDPAPDGFMETEDGGIVINPGQTEEQQQDLPFGANLAEHMDEGELNALGSQICEWVTQDKETCSDWANILTKGIEYLGITMEERTYPFPGASGVFDTVLMEAVCRWQATASGELMPAEGPVKTQIIGISNEQLEQQAWRVKEFMNLYLTDLAPEYIEENDQMLFWLPLVGSTFKKTYFDPVLQRPVSRFILPENFIVKYTTTDLETCERMTQVIPMTQRELKLRQLSKFYLDIDLGDPTGMETAGDNPIRDKVNAVEGMQPNQLAQDHLHAIYESHIDLDLKGFEHKTPEDEESGLPLPYIVSIDRDSRKVLAIRRNWNENDKTFKKNLYFTHFKFVPGLGFYGFGYAHLLGNSAKAATSLRRQMIDAETLAMFPGGLRVKGMRLTDNNLTVGPCEFAEIDTGGLPIAQAIMTMPYKGASPVSLQLLQETYQAAKSLVGNSEVAVGEGRQDAPVGTTVALLEAALKLQSATIKRAHRAYRREFKIIASLFGQYLPEKPYPFPVAGGMQAIMRSDFSNHIDVIPVSDPNITSFAQRMMRADAIVQSAMAAPQIHNLYQAYRQRYIEMGVDDARLNMILPPPQQAQPADPLTENMNMTKGTPVAAAQYQDHDAHIQAHTPLTEGAQPIPAATAHIAEHTAFQMQNQVQTMLGIQLPPPGTKLPPQIENQIAVLVAQAMQHIQQSEGAPTPDQIAWEQVKVEAQRVAANLAKIESDAQTKAYMERMKFESDQRERQTRIQIAAMKERESTKRSIHQTMASVGTAVIRANATKATKRTAQ